MAEHLTILQLAEEDRPRERAMSIGIENLSNSELIAILLGSGTREQTAIDVARGLLKRYDDRIDLLSRANLKELTSSNGIGTARAIVIMAALELGRRRSALEAKNVAPVLTDSNGAYLCIRPYLYDQTEEHLYAIMLNAANRVTKIQEVSVGVQSAVLFDVRKITRMALDAGAAAVIMAHNHPSGNSKPSREDEQVTRQLRDALQLFDIKLPDHLIVCACDYFSMADHGMI